MNKLKAWRDVDSSAGDLLKPGSDHYRAYVGPPRDYDLISAMVFNLLTCCGLRQTHKVLDIGCGSLRIGRLLIPYLNSGNYYGVEPNQWLVFDGLANEVGRAQYRIKSPNFLFCDSFRGFDKSVGFDYCFAQSIFSHCGIDLVEKWFEDVSFHLSKSGVFLATFVLGEYTTNEQGWIYPGCVKFAQSDIRQLSSQFGLQCLELDWYHPRQSWFAFFGEDFDSSLLKCGKPTWGPVK